MEKEQQEQSAPAIMINTQYIKDMSLEIPHAPEIFREITAQPQLDIKVDIDTKHLQDNFFNVSLHFVLNGDVNDKKLFILELEYAGVVALNIPQEHLEPVLMVEIPRMLFPFARSVITNTLVSGGLPPFMINPIDFVAMYEAHSHKAEGKQAN